VLRKDPHKCSRGEFGGDIFFRQKRNTQASHGGFAERQRAVGIERSIDPERSAALANKRPNTIMLVRAEMGQAGIVR
jgi:hypothetical protein